MSALARECVHFSDSPLSEVLLYMYTMLASTLMCDMKCDYTELASVDLVEMYFIIIS